MNLVKKIILTFLIILLSSVLFSACRELYPIDKLTHEEVINIVYEYGIPNLPDGTIPLGNDQVSRTVKMVSPEPILKWQAGYLGDGKWRIQGVIATEPENKRYMTIWILYADRPSEQWEAPNPADGWVSDGIVLEGIIIDSVDAMLVLTEF